MLTDPAWERVAGLRHGFLGRDGSGGPPWRVVVDGAVLPVATVRQVHGARVVTAVASDDRPEADGVVAGTPGLLVGVLTADCVPILLVDRGRRAAAALHAGWRGAAAGVLAAGLAQLGVASGTTPADVEAVIGPAIGGCCYEVGAEVRAAFRARTGDLTAEAWERYGARWHVDLRAAARTLLLTAGVGRVALVGPCTRCDPGYHSYRRDGAGAGRQLSFVGWE